MFSHISYHQIFIDFVLLLPLQRYKRSSHMTSQSNILSPNNSNYRKNSFRSQPYALNRGSYLARRDRSRSQSPVNYTHLNPNANNYNNLNSQSFKRMMDDIYMYPTGFAEILRNEDRNLKTFKLSISRQKQRVDQDMQSFKVQLNHILEDLRLSLHAFLDRIYQSYLDKASKFRGELFEINRLKQQLQIELGASSLAQLQAKIRTDTQNIDNVFKNIAERDIDRNLLTSNINLLAEKDPSNPLYISPHLPNLNPNVTLQAQKNQTISNMQVGNKQLKKYYILNHIAEMQKQRMLPLNQLQRELVTLNSYQNGFYQSKQFHRVLTNLRDILSNEVRKIYDNNYLYIRDIDSIMFKEKELHANGNRVLEGVDLNPFPINNTVINSRLGGGYGTFIPINKTITQNYPVNQSKSFNRIGGIYGANLQGTISPSEQSLRVNAAENINLVQQPINIQLPNTLGMQIALCGIFINNQIALGLKDGTIQIFSCDGHNIATLKQHRANICTLAVIRTKNQNYLASGSDVGCCRVVIWDPVTWQAKSAFNAHQAAVTGIVDLQDDVHLVSAGYDKKMNVFSLEQGRLVHSAPQSQSPITSLVINKSGNKLITAGLDKAMCVWSVMRDYRLKAENIVLQRKIQNNATMCAVVASQILPQLVVIATKDGKIKLVNIDKGESYKTISFNNIGDDNGLGSNFSAYPLEMTIIERDNKPYYPLALVWPHRQQKLYQISTETTLVSVKNLGMSGGTLEYGYGVSPKCFFVSDSGRGALVYSVNQKINISSSNGSNNCVTVHRIEELR